MSTETKEGTTARQQALPAAQERAPESKAIVRGPQARLDSIKRALENNKGAIAAVLPQHLTAERLFKLVTTAASRSPDLLDCTPESVVLAVMQASALGLEPNTPLQLAALVPFKNKHKGNRMEAQFIPMYKGLIRLAYQSGEVTKIHARLVHERDSFELIEGVHEDIKHKRYRGSEGRGAIVGAYAVAHMRNGEPLFEFMDLEELEAIRNSSKAKEDGPWVDHRGEMYRKTVLRRLCKFLPLSAENLARAMEHQATAESGAPPDYSDIITVLGETEEGAPTITGEPPPTRTEAMRDRLAKQAEPAAT